MHEHPEILGKSGLAEWDAATKGKHLPETKGNTMKKKHPFSHTHMEHHGDGSITVHHQHESDSKKDIKHAVPDLDAAQESMEQHLGPQAAAPGAPGSAPGSAPPVVAQEA